MNKIAIIDLGTNTFHLLIMSGGKTLHAESVAVRIGMGGINQGLITEEGVQRAVAALQNFRNTIDRHGVRTVMAFGTSALRNASNGAEVAAMLQDKTGIPITIISGDEEATFIYEGVRAAVPMGDQTCLIVDIGGGSVEFIIADGSEMFWKHSFEIGGQRLLERFQKHDPIEPNEITAIKNYLTIELQPLLTQLKKYQPATLIGSSGTFDTLSEMYCFGMNIPYQKSDPETPLTIASILKSFSAFKQRNRASRLQMPGMIELRVDMIVVACCLIEFILELHPFKKVRVSTYSLKEGVLRSLPPY